MAIVEQAQAIRFCRASLEQPTVVSQPVALTGPRTWACDERVQTAHRVVIPPWSPQLLKQLYYEQLWPRSVELFPYLVVYSLLILSLMAVGGLA